MICNPTNYKPHKSVYDVETKQQFHSVVSIDTETGRGYAVQLPQQSHFRDYSL